MRGVAAARDEGMDMQTAQTEQAVDRERPGERDEDERLMRLALDLGRRGLGRTWPNPAVGAAIVKAGVARVVSALEDPKPQVAGRGHATLRAKGVAVEVGLLAEAARRMHAGHILRVTERRPHVLLKLAISADGRAGRPGRRPAAISGEQARARVFQLRAQSDAILVGIGTVLADHPQLTCRLPGMM